MQLSSLLIQPINLYSSAGSHNKLQEKKRVRRRRSGPMKPKTEEPLRKGKTYRSSAGRELKEKDPNSKEVLDKKYRLDTKPGNTGSKLISRLIIYYFLMSIKLILS